jgi:molecular chaperone GrpE
MENETDETTAQTEAATAADRSESIDPVELKQQRDDYYDRLLRKTAEFDNYRKRIERERTQLSEAAAADLLQEMLPLVDDMERALKADPGTDSSAATEAFRRGVELIHQQLLKTLGKRGVKPIDALGQDFDPHFHQAVAHEPADGRREGEVVEEFSRGYMLGDRLLRPAMVKVAKG